MQETCGAHCRTTGQPCKNAPVTDSTRCRMHGGKTPKAKARAAQIGIVRQARKALADFNVEPVTNPLEALQQHAAEVVSLRDYLRDQVSRLEALRYEGGSGEQVRAELAAYQAALRDTTAVLVSMARLDIDSRIVQINTRIGEAQGAVIAGVIRAILGDLNLTAGQQALVAQVVPRRLRELTGGGE